MDKEMKNNLFMVAVDYLFAQKMVSNQKELAEKIGITDSALSRIKNGTKTVSDDTLRKMNEAFGCVFDMSYFRGQSENLLENSKPKQPVDQSSLINAALASRDEIIKSKEEANESQRETIGVLEARIADLEARIRDKERIIQLLENEVRGLKLDAEMQRSISGYPDMMSNLVSEENQ